MQKTPLDAVPEVVLRRICTPTQLLPAALLITPLLACASGARQLVLVPLQDEAELHLEARPLPAVARGLRFEVVQAQAIETDGGLIPLTLRHALLSPEQRGERLLASGRLPPGKYSGLSLTLRKAQGAEPPETVRVDAPFSLSRGRALVLALEVRGASFPPAFEVSVPPKPLQGLTAWCSSSAQHELTVFDKHSRHVAEVIPTGRAPWGIALDPVQGRAFVSVSGEDRIQVIDILSSQRIADVRLSAGDAPRELALTPDRRLLITANSGSNSVSFIDPGSMIEIGRARAGEEPTWIVIDRRGLRAYVSNAGGNTVTVLDLTNRAAVGMLALEDRPLRAQLDRAGNRLYVAQPHSAYLTVFSLPDLAVQKRVYVGLGASGLKVDPATDLIYLAKRDEGRLAVYDSFSFIPVDSVEVPDAASHLNIDDAENVLFLLMPESRSVVALDLNSRRTLAVIDVGDEPRSCALMGERN